MLGFKKSLSKYHGVWSLKYFQNFSSFISFLAVIISSLIFFFWNSNLDISYLAVGGGGGSGAVSGAGSDTGSGAG